MKTTFLLLLVLCLGANADDIKTKDGTLLNDATVTASDAAGVTIAHADDGIAKVPFD
ncbi:MAG TPA: hypothetical protein VGO11_22720 [Chthoniobacteraceae bacterium]|jgi:hypothetical protein|nr:hypothetical protein [Chthoniobacteraceae bacterium]